MLISAFYFRNLNMLNSTMKTALAEIKAQTGQFGIVVLGGKDLRVGGKLSVNLCVASF